MTSAPFHNLAPLYDVIYARRKDYAAEARQVSAWINAAAPRASTLLDVACGTGLHLRHLATRFDVAGLDLHDGMLAEAARKLPDVPLVCGDMRSARLGRTFDAVTCLFASTGYLPDVAALREAVVTMAAHCAPDGVIIIEPSLFPEDLQPPQDQVDTFLLDGREVTRRVSAVHRNEALDITFDLHFEGTAAPPDFSELHRISLFQRDAYERAFAAVGFRAKYVASDIVGRGVFIGVSPRHA